MHQFGVYDAHRGRAGCTKYSNKQYIKSLVDAVSGKRVRESPLFFPGDGISEHIYVLFVTVLWAASAPMNGIKNAKMKHFFPFWVDHNRKY